MLPIHERFYTWQGEGVHMGRGAFFIRTFGCPLHCPWCDSAGTWHKDYVPTHINRMEEEALAQEAQDAKAPFVVVTGGEPAIHDLRMLTAAMHLRGIDCHLETSGAFPINGRFDWVTLSPKHSKLPCLDALVLANEFKLIIEKPEDIEYWMTFLGSMATGKTVWLHPEWTHREDQKVLSAITNAVKEHPRAMRAGWQLHKLYRCDTLDVRSAAPVPLGGNPKLGY